MSLRPAWSEAFDGVRAVPGLEGITRDWAYGDRRGAGVKVAIVDSGVDGANPAVGGLAGAVIVEPDPDGVPGDVRHVDGPHADLYGHGTACAAIVRELAPGIELWSVRVLGERLTGKGWVFAAGLDWCIEHGMDVVNLSLSTASDDYYATFHDIVDRAVHAGVVLVSAMANERKSTYPSEFSGVLSVAATEGTDRDVLWRNPAPPAEWGAPGIDVDVAWLGGATISVTGNSFAAPVVAGHAARVLGAHPGLAPWEVKAVLAALAGNAGT
ncbi:MAG: S8 family serine peptidase [Acidimicrobiia bacterium]|nr:S8 family serine peptidase [Acidimicrobiia bacterium]